MWLPFSKFELNEICPATFVVTQLEQCSLKKQRVHSIGKRHTSWAIIESGAVKRLWCARKSLLECIFSAAANMPSSRNHCWPPVAVAIKSMASPQFGFLLQYDSRLDFSLSVIYLHDASPTAASRLWEPHNQHLCQPWAMGTALHASAA